MNIGKHSAAKPQPISDPGFRMTKRNGKKCCEQSPATVFEWKIYLGKTGISPFVL